jgi:hypothetical protein
MLIDLYSQEETFVVLSSGMMKFDVRFRNVGVAPCYAGPSPEYVTLHSTKPVVWVKF